MGPQEAEAVTSSWHIPFWMAWASVCLGGRCPRVFQVSLAHLERQKVRALEVTLALHMGHLSLMRSRFCLEGGRKDRQVVALFKISEGGGKNRVTFQRCGPWPGHVTATCTPPGGTARPRFPRSQKPPLRSGMRPRGTCRRSDNKADHTAATRLLPATRRSPHSARTQDLNGPVR